MELTGRTLKVGLSGDDVELLQTALAVLSLPAPEEETRSRAFGRGTEDAVIRFQREHELEPTGIVDGETARAIKAAISAGRYAVEGTVSSPDRAGIGALRVDIVDKTIGPDVLLAQATTDARGRYRAQFTAASAAARGNGKPDLQARVFAGDTFLAASKVRYDASNRETLHVRLPANCAALPSEHETLVAALAAEYEGGLAELREGGDRQDITYLANKTGWDARDRVRGTGRPAGP